MSDPFTELDRLGRGRLLHLGCDRTDHELPSPWENFRAEVDITRKLPFPPNSASHVLAEHLVQAVSFASGHNFLAECFRVLEPGGVLRLSFPDPTRFDESNLALYLSFVGQLPGNLPAETHADALRHLLDHRRPLSCWTADSAEAVLLAVGFGAVARRDYGRSPNVMLDGIDGAHLTTSLTAASIETTVLEAIK